jgi:hypothetical protein
MIHDPKSIIMPYNEKFGTLAGLGSRPQAQMTMEPIQKTFLVLRPFEGALTCPIMIAGRLKLHSNFFFLGETCSKWANPRSCGSPSKISGEILPIWARISSIAQPKNLLIWAQIFRAKLNCAGSPISGEKNNYCVCSEKRIFLGEGSG